MERNRLLSGVFANLVCKFVGILLFHRKPGLYKKTKIGIIEYIIAKQLEKTIHWLHRKEVFFSEYVFRVCIS